MSLLEIKRIFADCQNYDSNYYENLRQLQYKSKDLLSPNEAYNYLSEAIPNSYNDFTADLIQLFPDDCKIKIAREYSAGKKKLPTQEQLLASEYDKQEDGYYRIWWD